MASKRLPSRGGNWNNGSNAGLAALHCNHSRVFPVSKRAGRALDFLGYRIYPTHRLLRKSSIKRIKYKLRRMRAGLAAGAITLSECRPAIESWVAHTSHANTYRLRKSLFSEPMITGATK